MKPRTEPMTAPAMAPLEILCEGDGEAEDVCDNITANNEGGGVSVFVVVVLATFATPYAKPSYGSAYAWATEVVAVKIDEAWMLESS